MVARLTHTSYIPESTRGANERCFGNREDRGEEGEEDAFNERKRGSPAVRINDVSRVHITEGKEEGPLEWERKTAYLMRV